MSTTPQDTRRTYHAVADVLMAHGVRTIFGLMGEDGAALVTDLVDRGGVRYIGARHENAAVNMAEGHAWGTGELGVAIISRGPGLTNATTSLETAGRSGSRTLVIAGDAPTGWPPGLSDVKAFPSEGLLRSLHGGFRRAAEPGDVAAVLAEAIAEAQSGRLVVYLVPADTLNRKLDDAPEPPPAPYGAPVPSPAPAPVDRDALERATGLLADAHRPLVVAGAGAVAADAREPLVELADRAGALLGTSLLAKDLFRGHPYDIGILGGFAGDVARELAADADCAVAFGASLNSFTTAQGRLLGDLPLIRVDHDPAALLGGPPADVELIGDCRQVASALVDALPAHVGAVFRTPDIARRIAEAPRLSAAEPAPRENVLDPRVLTLELDRRLPARRSVVIDSGHNLGFGAQYISVPGPRHFRTTFQFGAIGMSLGTALGIAEAQIDSQVVLCIGDGSLLMTLGELETAARSAIPLLIVVYNDQAYGAERHFLDVAGLPRHTSMFPDTDFAAVANALGMRGVTVTSVADLAPVKLDSRLGAPLLLDCKIDPAFRARWFDEFAG